MNNSGTLQALLIMLLGALILQFMPMPGDWMFWKPNFLLLIMIAWILYLPEQYGIEFAVIMGLFADFIFSTTLGYHILIFSICGLILIFFHRIVVYLQLVHRVTLVFMMVLFVEFMRATIDATMEKSIFIEDVLSLAIISALCWIPLDKFVGHFYSQHK